MCKDIKAHRIYMAGIIFLLLVAMTPSVNAEAWVDQSGRTVAVPETPKRLVSLAPSITEIIFDLKCEDRLKGVTTYSNFPAAAKKIPRVGSYVYLDLEKIVSLQPDLCIGIQDGNPKAIVLRLESMGIPVYCVNPRSLASIRAAVLEIGAVLQASDIARRIAGDMQSRIQRVRQLTASIKHRPRVFFQIGIAPIVSAGSDTFIHELIEIAGGSNIAQSCHSYPRFSMEDVVAAAPDILMITSMARNKTFEQVKKEWQQWPTIPAVKNDRIFLLDSDLLDRPTPRLIDGMEMLLHLIHPELDHTAARKETCP